MNIEQYEVINVRRYKAGYEIRTIIVPADESGTGEPMEMKQAFTPTGDWIGPSKLAHQLIVEMGIKPEKRAPELPACSIGFSEKYQKWYGWSHRAMFGYKIGHVVDKDSIVTNSDFLGATLRMSRGFQAQTLQDCKDLAMAFAQAIA